MSDQAQAEAHAAQAEAPDREWWRGAVIYQIYPRSFQDSNGDGVGDLAGVTQRLSYVAALGVDAIWLSPFFPSPMKDFGYDVSDYQDVDPLFGSLADFDALMAEARRLGLKVIIDQVISHTSDAHPWFKESRTGRDNPKADWFVWADAKPDGTPPNNWLSIFGGSAWEWETGRRQYYLHNFLGSQPDLNFHNRAVQDALLATVRFWLERGVDGFRLDTINFYFHAQSLQDNPALPENQRNDSIAPAVNPYNFQDHLFDKSQPENLQFLERFRALLNEYPAAASVGEVGDAQRGREIVGQYTSGDKRVHMCYSFDLLGPEPLTGRHVRETVEGFAEAAPEGWSCWAFSNHDVVRHATRWGDAHNNDPRFLKVAAALLMALRGSVCLYEGEELGLTEANLRLEDLQDPYGIRFWPTFKGRDGCRTPMVWNAGALNGGFSSTKPWLPVPAEHLALAADAQETKDGSVLAFYKRMLGFRKQHPALRIGAIEFLTAEGDAVAFKRRGDGEEVICAFNLGGSHAVIAVEGTGDCATLAEPGLNGEAQGNGVSLPAYGAWFGRRAVD